MKKPNCGSESCSVQRWSSATLVLVLVLLASLGCQRASTSDRQSATAQPASLKVRAARRAFDGAPPTIPHVPFGTGCTTCHVAGGKIVPTVGVAPANPHIGDPRAASLTNCLQCHVFTRSRDLFVENDFESSAAVGQQAARAHPLAPPVIPHTLAMRANCAACHCGVAARPEIVCSHPERTACLQCHTAVESSDTLPIGLATIQESASGEP